MRDEEGKGKGKMIFKIILTALMAASMAIPSAFLSGCSKTDDTSKEDNMNTYSIEKVEHEPGEPLTDDEIDELYGDGQLNSDWHVRKWYDISMVTLLTSNSAKRNDSAWLSSGAVSLINKRKGLWRKFLFEQLVGGFCEPIAFKQLYAAVVRKL